MPTISGIKNQSPHVHRRSVAPTIGTSEIAGIATVIFRSQSHSASEARLLFRAIRATWGHNQGRRAVNHAKRPTRNCPLESIKRSIDGKVKSNSSEITFTTANPAPRPSAARATADASMSTACPANESRNCAFCAGLAIDPKLTNTPSPKSRLTLLPSPASTTRRGCTRSPTLRAGSSAPAKPAE